jgi:NAD(P) transhydrogenase
VETVHNQLTRNRIEIVPGLGSFLDPNRVLVQNSDCSQNTELTADNFLIATGTRPAHNPLFDFSKPNVFDSDMLLTKKDYVLPRDLIVVGTGVIAMEVPLQSFVLSVFIGQCGAHSLCFL